MKILKQNNGAPSYRGNLIISKFMYEKNSFYNFLNYKNEVYPIFTVGFIYIFAKIELYFILFYTLQTQPKYLNLQIKKEVVSLINFSKKQKEIIKAPFEHTLEVNEGT